MKNLFKIQLALALIIGLNACTSEDDPAPQVPQYADQVLQGTVHGDSWTVQTATIVSLVDPLDTTSFTHYISLSMQAGGNSCDSTFGGRSTPILRGEKYVAIAIDNGEPIVKNGDYNFYSTESDGNAELNFIDFTGGGTFLIGTTGGKMEITRVDTAARIVEGRILAEDVNFDSNSSVNGNFSATYCLQ